MSGLITLLTDFGTQDPYVGAMKGVILSIAPDVRIVDLTHEVAPQNVRQASFALASVIPYYKAGAIHLAVVDPGVGTDRAAVVIECEDRRFVGPDNGIFTLALEACPPKRAWRLTRPEYFMATVSQTFHGRDVFAPVAAHLSRGVPASDLGEPYPVDRLERFESLPPRFGERSVLAQIVYVDRFGNLITNLREDAGRAVRSVSLGHLEAPLATSYRDVGEGEYLCVWGSFGLLEVSRSMGDAATSLGLGVGDDVHIHLA